MEFVHKNWQKKEKVTNTHIVGSICVFVLELEINEVTNIPVFV